MKKNIVTLTALFLTSLGLYAQDFKNSLFESGFDSESDFNIWTEEKSPADNNQLWKIDSEESSFSEINKDSKSSLYFHLGEEEKYVSTITSPTIDAKDKKGIVAGFYGLDIERITSWSKCALTFEISKDNGASWTSLFNSQTDRYSGKIVKDWRYYFFYLPSDFDGNDLKIRFKVDASEYNGWGTSFYIDGVFVAQRNEAEAELSSFNFYDPSSSVLYGIFSEPQSFVISIKNNSLEAISNFNVGFKINEQQPIVETFTDKIESGENAVYTFKNKGNIAEFGASYDIKTWVDLTNDSYRQNDTITSTVENILDTPPYEPTFKSYKDGQLILDSDSWETITDKNANITWRKNYNDTEEYTFWYTDFSRAYQPGDAILYSKPLYLNAGSDYFLRFDAYTALTSESDDKKNDMYVYITENPESVERTKIWEMKNIDKSNALDTEISLSVPQTGIYYIVFNCSNTKLKTDELRLKNISVVERGDIDAGLQRIVSPQNGKLVFSKEEPLTISIRGVGKKDIEANTIQASFSLNGENTVTENIPVTIKSDDIVSYTFNHKLDLSDISKEYNLNVWLSGQEDIYQGNDTLKTVLKNFATNVPYTADFSVNDDQSFKENVQYWKIVDNNNDGESFKAIVPSSWSTTYNIYYNYDENDIATTDETVYARPLVLEKGKLYRFEFRTSVQNKENAEINIKTALNKLDNNGNIVENKLIEENTYSSNNSFNFVVEVEETGIYSVSQQFSKNENINFYLLCFQSMIVTETNKNDIALNNVIIPGNKISAYKELPVGIEIFNNGVSPIKEFTAYIKKNTEIICQQKFDTIIESQKTATVSFDKLIKFEGKDKETYTFEVGTDEDGIASNNTKEVTFEYIDSYTAPCDIKLTGDEGFMVINKAFDYEEFEYSSSSKKYYISYVTNNEYGEDLLISPSIRLVGEKAYKIAFDYSTYVYGMIAPALSVYILNCSTNEKTQVTTIVSDGNYNNKYSYIGYTEVQQDGEYVFIFDVAPGEEITAGIINQLFIDEVTELPDIEMLEITAPATESVLGENETITATFRNSGNMPLESISFICEINGNKFYNSYFEEIATGEEAEISFAGINLNEPGDYEAKITAEVYHDKTVENNSIVKNIKSLPVIDMKLLSIDSPKSGNLSNEEDVTITVASLGKGNLKDIPVHYEIENSEKSIKLTADEMIPEIAQGDTIQFTFTTKADLPVEGTYNIKVYTNIAMDIDTSNDTIATSFVATEREMDAGVTDITAPVEKLMTRKERISIMVKNFSDFDLYDIPVYAKVSKDGNVVKELTGTVQEAKAGESVEYTFNDECDMYMYGTYEIIAETRLENDSNKENDQFTASVNALRYDCGVSEIINPLPVCETGEQDITVTVKNYGDIEISNIPIFFTVGSMPQTGSVKETIAPGESIVFTFPAPYRFREGREYNLQVYTELEGDMDSSNDTTSIVVTPKIGIEYVSEDGINVYPNPVSEFVNISSENIIESIILTDSSGKTIKALFDVRDKKASIQTGELTEGIYVLVIKTDNAIISKKIVKQ